MFVNIQFLLVTSSMLFLFWCLNLLQLPRIITAIRHCEDEFLFFDSTFFNSNFPKNFLSKEFMHPSWWKGELTVQAAWDLLTASDYMRSSVSMGNLEHWRSIFDAVESGEEIQVTVLGGALTKGVDCGIGEESRCAWPHRLEEMLRFIGISNVKIRNFAVATADTSVGRIEVLSKVWNRLQANGMAAPKRQPDIIVLAFASNDYLLLHGHLQNDILQYESLHEELIREILRLPSKPMVVMMSEFSHFGNANDHLKTNGYLTEYGFKQQGYASNVASHYDLAMWSYKDAVWQKHLTFCVPFRDSITGNVTSNFDCRGSPYHNARSAYLWSGGHQMMAFVGLYNIFHTYGQICNIDDAKNYTNSRLVPIVPLNSTELLARSLPPPLFPRPVNERPFCKDFSYLFTATEPGVNDSVPENVNAITTSSGWVYYSDKKNLYGWVAQQEHAVIELPATLGKSCDIVEIGYISSYGVNWGLLAVELEFEVQEMNPVTKVWSTVKKVLPLGPYIEAYSPRARVTSSTVIQLQSRLYNDRHNLFRDPEHTIVNCSSTTPAKIRFQLNRGNRFKILSYGVCDDEFQDFDSTQFQDQ